MALSEYGAANADFSDWMEAFEILRGLLEKKRSKHPLIVFIDELPCFDTQRSGFVHALGHFWNNWAAWRGDVKLIVCGSATSWMTRRLLDARGGLHNRLTNTLHLKPFTLRETQEYLKANAFRWSRLTVAQCYMVLGGIPYYLTLLDSSESLAQNIDRLFFSKDEVLRSEYRRLYGSLFKNPDYYVKVVELLSKSRQGMTRSEIAGSIASNRKLSAVLEDLQQCGFVEYMNVRGRNGGLKSSDGIYHLCDFYTLFYLDFCKGKTSDEQYWTHKMNTPKVNTWYGLAFERLCMAHIPQIKKALGISGIHTEHYSWRSRHSDPGAQIDLMIERSDDMINLCEIKYSAGEYSLSGSEWDKIQTRQNAFVGETLCRQGIFLTLITTSGAKMNEYAHQMNNILTLEDLFE